MTALVYPSKAIKLPPGKAGPFVVREGYEYAAVCACGFSSTGWPTKKQANIRRMQHELEHTEGTVMPDQREVEALTPDKFRSSNVAPPTSFDDHPLSGFMAIVAGDLLYKYSVAAAAGNTTAGTAAGSLGDQISTTAITDATLGNLFDDVTGDENALSDVEYRGYFVHNNHGSLTWTAPFAWLSAEVAGGAVAAIAISGTAASAVGSGSTQMETIANESTAPSGPSFSAPTTKGTGLALSDVPAGNVKGIWVRRTAANTAAVANDGVTVRVEGDTAA